MSRLVRSVNQHIAGDNETNFKQLRPLLAEIATNDPSFQYRVAEEADIMVTADVNRFYGVLWTPGYSRNAFENACNVLAVDAAHGRTDYGGCWVVIATVLATGNYVPVCTGYVCAAESEAMWEWVLRTFKTFGFEDTATISIISDRCKGLEAALGSVYPECVGAGGHTACSLHVVRNAMAKCKMACPALQQLGGRLAQATTLDEWDMVLGDLVETDGIMNVHGTDISASVVSKFVQYLSDGPQADSLWSFALQPSTSGYKMGVSTSNAAEVTHAALDRIRQLPISTAVRTFISAQYTRFFKLRQMIKQKATPGAFALCDGKFRKKLEGLIEGLPRRQYRVKEVSSLGSKYVAEVFTWRRMDPQSQQLVRDSALVDFTAAMKRTKQRLPCQTCKLALGQGCTGDETCECCRCKHSLVYCGDCMDGESSGDQCAACVRATTDVCVCDRCTKREVRCGDCIMLCKPCGCCATNKPRCLDCEPNADPCLGCTQRHPSCSQCTHAPHVFTPEEYMEMAERICNACNFTRVWGIPCWHVLAAHEGLRTPIPQSLLTHPRLHAGAVHAAVANCVEMDPAAINVAALDMDELRPPFSLLSHQNKSIQRVMRRLQRRRRMRSRGELRATWKRKRSSGLRMPSLTEARELERTAYNSNVTDHAYAQAIVQWATRIPAAQITQQAEIVEQFFAEADAILDETRGSAATARRSEHTLHREYGTPECIMSYVINGSAQQRVRLGQKLHWSEISFRVRWDGWADAAGNTCSDNSFENMHGLDVFTTFLNTVDGIALKGLADRRPENRLCSEHTCDWCSDNEHDE